MSHVRAHVHVYVYMAEEDHRVAELKGRGRDAECEHEALGKVTRPEGTQFGRRYGTVARVELVVWDTRGMGCTAHT